MTERWNVHTNDLGDRCPWSRTEITDDANTCPARCRDAEPDRHLSWKTRGPAPDWGKLGITPGTFSLTDEPNDNGPAGIRAVVAFSLGPASEASGVDRVLHRDAAPEAAREQDRLRLPVRPAGLAVRAGVAGRRGAREDAAGRHVVAAGLGAFGTLCVVLRAGESNGQD